MGGEWFEWKSNGVSAQDAFRNAVAQARYDYGHAGYTGTIAEKDSFITIDVPLDSIERVTDITRGTVIRDLIETCYNDEDHFCQDKWGPAACVCLREPEKNREGVYVFFGWASC